jgi:integration host factor subunit alpha|tara:strand:- start:249 stop:491 length:243 start_codon:yes stop_codon:yes gene_type:complete
MQIGFSKKISQNILDDLLTTITDNIVSNKKIKISKFGTFSIREKKSRVGRNPKTKVSKIISSRNVVLFKPSKEFKNLINE